MNCLNCQAALQLQWVFCPQCGHAVQHDSRLDLPGAGSPNFQSPFARANIPHSAGVRAQVFEVIVRQAEAGAPWREICAGPMSVNKITAQEVEEELARRQGGGGPTGAAVPKTPSPWGDGGPLTLNLPQLTQRIAAVREVLQKLLDMNAGDLEGFRRAIEQLDQAAVEISQIEQCASAQQQDAALQQDLERELMRNRRPLQS